MRLFLAGTEYKAADHERERRKDIGIELKYRVVALGHEIDEELLRQIGASVGCGAEQENKERSESHLALELCVIRAHNVAREYQHGDADPLN